jgi:uncharacterized protein YcbX
VRLDARGVEFDRIWALVDHEGGIASAKRTRRFRKVPGLLRHGSRLEGAAPIVTLSDGRRARAGTREMIEIVEAMAGPGWSLEREDDTPHFDADALHLVTTATLASLSAAIGARVAVEACARMSCSSWTAAASPRMSGSGRSCASVKASCGSPAVSNVA